MDGSRYHMDFDHLEDILKRRRCPLLIWQIRTIRGYMWDRETLATLAEICHKYNVTVISDEIHADMPLYGNNTFLSPRYHPEAAQIGVVFNAPSKTFNIAGLVSSYAIVPNQQLRKGFYDF